jgi:hypothetical protein
MQRVPASIGGSAAGLASGLAIGLAFGLVALSGVAIAQEAEPTPTGRIVDASGDAVRAVPDANGNYSANGDGEDVVYGDIGPGTVIGEPIVVETTGAAPVESAEPAPEPVAVPVVPDEAPAEPVLDPEAAVEAPEEAAEIPVEEAAPAPPTADAPVEAPPAPEAETPPFDSFTISNEDGDAAAYGVPGRPEDSSANARPGRIEGIPSFQEVQEASAAQEASPAEPVPSADAAPVAAGTPVAEAAPGEVAASPVAVVPVASCDDFSAWYDAQVAYEAEGGVAADPALVAALDPDADGIACEEAVQG